MSLLGGLLKNKTLINSALGAIVGSMDQDGVSAIILVRNANVQDGDTPGIDVKSVKGEFGLLTGEDLEDFKEFRHLSATGFVFVHKEDLEEYHRYRQKIDCGYMLVSKSEVEAMAEDAVKDELDKRLVRVSTEGASNRYIKADLDEARQLAAEAGMSQADFNQQLKLNTKLGCESEEDDENGL